MIFCEKQRNIFFLKIAYVDSLSAKNHFPDKKRISLPNSLPVPSPKQGISLFFRKKTLYNNWISTNTAIYPVSAKKPYDYVACAYQQIRHVAYVMFSIHIAKTEEERKACEEMYGSEALKLYELVKDEVDEGVIQDLFQ